MLTADNEDLIGPRECLLSRDSTRVVAEHYPGR
jgi:hypothetical protein